ncbi:DUF2339 domain-containing protein [Bacteroidota bacterium]
MSKLFDASEKEPAEILRNLEQRIARLESVLNLEPIATTNHVSHIPSKTDGNQTSASDKLELQIGQYWFAKVGIVILALGIIFLMTFPYKNLPSFLPSLIGFFLTAMIFLFVHYSKESYQYISKYLLAGGLVLLYFSTMRFKYFGLDPTIPSETIEILLLASATGLNLLIALRKKSVMLTGIGITTGYITVVLSSNPIVMFLMLSFLAGLIVILNLKYEWNGLMLYGIAATFFIHFMWFLNNPLLGNKIALNNEPELNLYFILLYIIIFTFANLFRVSKDAENSSVKVSSFFIAVGGYGLYLIISLLRFQSDIVFLHLLSSILLLGISIAFWIREKSRYSTFFYAILGYTSLSVAIIAKFPSPDFFVWLCWQSLLVIVTSIWFRSKFIIVANFIIYLGLFIVYLVLAGEIGAFTLSYGVVALVSARLLNYRKEKLNLKTEFMRNAYLGVAFVIFPYALYNSLPSGYVAVSWIVVAFLYYMLSLYLKNKKYRWMALLTILLTVFYILLIGTTQLEPIFRVVSFLILGIVLLVISMIYAKRKVKID